MFYGDSTQDTRQLFFSSWRKHRQNQPLSALEKQLVEVIIDHPEYQSMFEAVIPQQDQAYFPEMGQTNPFLHMGLHLAIRDQVATDRPLGLANIYNQLLSKYANRVTVEHMLMEPLAECLWQAQRNQGMVDERSYLSACQQLLLA